MIDAGELGTVGVARTSRRSPFLTGWNDWYADWRMSGGVLVDLVIHDFDFLRWSLGEVEKVYAKGVMGREYNRLDYALVTLRFESGAIAHVEGQWSQLTARSRHRCNCSEERRARAIVPTSSPARAPSRPSSSTLSVASRPAKNLS